MTEEPITHPRNDRCPYCQESLRAAFAEDAARKKQEVQRGPVVKARTPIFRPDRIGLEPHNPQRYHDR